MHFARLWLPSLPSQGWARMHAVWSHFRNHSEQQYLAPAPGCYLHKLAQRKPDWSRKLNAVACAFFWNNLPWELLQYSSVQELSVRSSWGTPGDHACHIQAMASSSCSWNCVKYIFLLDDVYPHPRNFWKRADSTSQVSNHWGTLDLQAL